MGYSCHCWGPGWGLPRLTPLAIPAAAAAPASSSASSRHLRTSMQHAATPAPACMHACRAQRHLPAPDNIGHGGESRYSRTYAGVSYIGHLCSSQSRNSCRQIGRTAAGGLQALTLSPSVSADLVWTCQLMPAHFTSIGFTPGYRVWTASAPAPHRYDAAPTPPAAPQQLLH